jgi:hypothetical protein
MLVQQLQGFHDVALLVPRLQPSQRDQRLLEERYAWVVEPTGVSEDRVPSLLGRWQLLLDVRLARVFVQRMKTTWD